MGRTFPSVRQGVNRTRGPGGPGRPGAQEGRSAIRRRLAKLAKTHSSEAFVACDDPLEGVVFSALVEILKRQDELEADTESMWILDSAYRDGGIDLWTKDGAVTKVHYDYNPPFHVHFHDPHAHHEMIEALEERYGAEECTIRTIFGELSGYAVTPGRDVAEAIERQARFEVDLFNVDVRRDQRFMAERGIFPWREKATTVLPGRLRTIFR